MMSSALALIDDYLDHSLDDATFGELCTWLEASKANQRTFIKRIALHNTIYEWSTERSGRSLPVAVSDIAEAEEVDGANSWLDTFFDEDQDQAPLDSKLARRDTIIFRQFASISGYLHGQALTSKLAYKAYGLAAAVLLVVTLIIVFVEREDISTDSLVEQNPLNGSQDGLQSDEARAPIVGNLTSEWDAKWDRQPEVDLYKGQRLTLTHGIAEITTARGAIALLEAPTTLEIIDKNAVYLHTGSLVGYCNTDSSKGFIVRTEHADIVDLGTKFGVKVKMIGGVAQTQTVVFDGEVLVSAPDEAEQPFKSEVLVAGEARQARKRSSSLQVVEHQTLTDSFIRGVPSAYEQMVIGREPAVYLSFEPGSGIGELASLGTLKVGAFRDNGSPRTSKGIQGRALQFDGFSRLAMPIEINELLTKPFTIEAWVWIDGDANAKGAGPARRILANAHADTKRGRMADGIGFGVERMYNNPDRYQPNFTFYGYAAYFSKQTVPANQWVHLAATVDERAGVSIYINGIASDIKTSLQPEPSRIRQADTLFQSSPRPIWIGDAVTNPVRNSRHSWYGKIDELAIYPRVLSADDLRDSYETALRFAP